jgi:hypothetical protein
MLSAQAAARRPLTLQMKEAIHGTASHAAVSIRTMSALPTANGLSLTAQANTPPAWVATNGQAQTASACRDVSCVRLLLECISSARVTPYHYTVHAVHWGSVSVSGFAQADKLLCCSDVGLQISMLCCQYCSSRGHWCTVMPPEILEHATQHLFNNLG